ncbi:hypothetical protein VTN00DRAFT_1024 [Thermoascus crustaceus]|uniref:uncharacterized protein n=1 Tax=Thermoascus crustaceus TaxID=5088 RepID=UPI0037446D7E
MPLLHDDRQTIESQCEDEKMRAHSSPAEVDPCMGPCPILFGQYPFQSRPLISACTPRQMCGTLRDRLKLAEKKKAAVSRVSSRPGIAWTADVAPAIPVLADIQPDNRIRSVVILLSISHRLVFAMSPCHPLFGVAFRETH